MLKCGGSSSSSSSSLAMMAAPNILAKYPCNYQAGAAGSGVIKDRHCRWSTCTGLQIAHYTAQRAAASSRRLYLPEYCVQRALLWTHQENRKSFTQLEHRDWWMWLLNGQLVFKGHIMRSEGLENLCKTGKREGMRARGRQEVCR